MKYSLKKDLKKIGKGVSEKKAKKLGLNLRKLKESGLVKTRHKVSVTYSMPSDAPRWASKYKFTRKKYNVVEHKSTKVIYYMTTKAKRQLKNAPPKDVVEDIMKEMDVDESTLEDEEDK